MITFLIAGFILFGEPPEPLPPSLPPLPRSSRSVAMAENALPTLKDLLNPPRHDFHSPRNFMTDAERQKIHEYEVWRETTIRRHRSNGEQALAKNEFYVAVWEFEQAWLRYRENPSTTLELVWLELDGGRAEKAFELLRFKPVNESFFSSDMNAPIIEQFALHAHLALKAGLMQTRRIEP